jgi:hypothetical protein
MKRYSIEKLVMFDFLTHNSSEQYGFRKGDGIIELDDNGNIWFISNEGKRHETNNMTKLIELYVRDGCLIEIK